MSSAPRLSWVGFVTRLASKIAPAQVPNVGFSETKARSLHRNPSRSRNFRNVDDSPPGITRPSMPSSSSGLRTKTVCTPNDLSVCRCASKSPCRARTPIVRSPLFTGFHHGDTEDTDESWAIHVFLSLLLSCCFARQNPAEGGRLHISPAALLQHVCF